MNSDDIDCSILFFKVFRHVVLRNHIFSFFTSTTTSKLLPKFRDDRESLHVGINYDKKEEFGKKLYYRYNQLTNVIRLSKYNKELLRFKVSRCEILNFYQEIDEEEYDAYSCRNNRCIYIDHIFGRFKNQVEDYQFFKNLFRNYKDYFITKRILYYIFKYDNLVAFKVINEIENIIVPSNINNDTVMTIKDFYVSAIKLGSINILEFIKSYGFNFKLNQDEVLYILNSLSFNIKKKSVDEEMEEDDEEMEEDEEEDEEMEEDEEESDDYLIFNGVEQIKEYGYRIRQHPDTLSQYRKNKVIQCLLSESLEILTIESLETPIDYVLDFSIEDKPLQFILDTCYTISYLEKILKSPNSKFISEPNPLICKYFGSPELDLILPILKLNEIKQKLISQPNLLSTNIEALDPATNGWEDIKLLVKMAIAFSDISCDKMCRVHCYLIKFQDIFLDLNGKDFFSLQSGQYESIGESSIFENHIRKNHREQLFKLCKLDSNKHHKFIDDLVIDVNTRGQDDQKAGKVFLLLIAYDDTKLVKYMIQELEKSEKGILFLYSIAPSPFNFLNSIEMFDLLYTDNIFKHSFRYSLLIDSCSSLKYTLPIDYGGPNMTDMLYHFKSNYTEDYYTQIKDATQIRTRFYANQFIYENYETDFKDILMKTSNYWEFYLRPKAGRSMNPIPELELNKFIMVFNSYSPSSLLNRYSTYNNVEIIAWVIKNHKDDLESGKCFPPSNQSLFLYYYYSNQLSKGLNFDYTNRLDKITGNYDTMTDHRADDEEDDDDDDDALAEAHNNPEFSNELMVIKFLKTIVLKKVVKFNDFDDLISIDKFIDMVELKNSNIQDATVVRELKSLKIKLMLLIGEFNNLEFFKYLSFNRPNDKDLKDNIKQITLYYLERFCCIDIINFILDNTNLEIEINKENIGDEEEEENLFYWRNKI